MPQFRRSCETIVSSSQHLLVGVEHPLGNIYLNTWFGDRCCVFSEHKVILIKPVTVTLMMQEKPVHVLLESKVRDFNGHTTNLLMHNVKSSED